MKRVKRIGILTAGGDCPGLNAAIRGVGKAVMGRGVDVVGIRDGFLGLIENRMLPLDRHSIAGILTVGGTVLGTSRVKPHRMEGAGGFETCATDTASCARNRLDAIMCIGGDGTQRNAIRLVEKGLPSSPCPDHRQRRGPDRRERRLPHGLG
jgi:6-phosphofructokinase 1